MTARERIDQIKASLPPPAVATLGGGIRAAWTLIPALEAVLAVHQPVRYGDAPDVDHCVHCQATGDPARPTGRTWPCPTVRIISAALDGAS